MLSHRVTPTEILVARLADVHFHGKSQRRWRAEQAERQHPESVTKERSLLLVREEMAMDSLGTTKTPHSTEIVLYHAYMIYHMCYHRAVKRRS